MEYGEANWPQNSFQDSIINYYFQMLTPTKTIANNNNNKQTNLV